MSLWNLIVNKLGLSKKKFKRLYILNVTVAVYQPFTDFIFSRTEEVQEEELRAGISVLM